MSGIESRKVERFYTEDGIEHATQEAALQHLQRRKEAELFQAYHVAAERFASALQAADLMGRQAGAVISAQVGVGICGAQIGVGSAYPTPQAHTLKVGNVARLIACAGPDSELSRAMEAMLDAFAKLEPSQRDALRGLNSAGGLAGAIARGRQTAKDMLNIRAEAIAGMHQEKPLNCAAGQSVWQSTGNVMESLARQATQEASALQEANSLHDDFMYKGHG